VTSFGFVFDGGPTWSEVTTRRVRIRLWLLGAIETLPLVGGIGFGYYFDPMIPYSATTAMGVALSILFCWLLRHQTPPTVIHAVLNGAVDGGEIEQKKTKETKR